MLNWIKKPLEQTKTEKNVHNFYRREGFRNIPISYVPSCLGRDIDLRLSFL